MVRFVTSRDGTRLATHDLGDPLGTPVLMVHGFASSTRGNWVDAGWDRAFGRAGIHGIALDLRGHGDSERHPKDARVPRFLDDVVAVLDDRGLDRVGYLGYSMGARLGWRVGAVVPERFSCLVLGGLPAHDPFQWLDPDLARRQLATGELATGPTGSVMAMVLRGDGEPAALIELAAQVAQTPFAPGDAVPPMPILLATGDEDRLASNTQELLPLAPHATFVPIPGRTHVSAITSGVFRRAAIDFVLAHADSIAR